MSENKNESKARVISDEEETTLLEGLSTLLGVVWSLGGEFPNLPTTYEACSEKQREAILARTWIALQSKQTNRDREVMRRAKGIVDGVIHEARKNRLEAYRAIYELVSKTPAVKAIMGKAAEAPTYVAVPVSELRHAYPGLNDEQIVKMLHNQNYKLMRGRSSEDGVPRLSVTITSEDVKEFFETTPE